MAEVRLTPAALGDLENIWAYTAEQWGAAQAAKYVDMLDAAFQRLAAAPMSAPPCDHIRTGYRRQIAGRHAIYYRIDDAHLLVVRVLHERMDAMQHL